MSDRETPPDDTDIDTDTDTEDGEGGYSPGARSKFDVSANEGLDVTPGGGDDDDEPEAKAWEGDDRRPFGVTKDQADRGADEHRFPNDDREGHEDNTFHLPDGRPIRRELKRWYARILKEVLGTAPDVGAPVTAHWPALADFADPMASAMTPLISAYWDEAGKQTRARLGLDPEEWRVVDPHLHDAIQAQSFAFCQSTLDTTTETVQGAYASLRGELLVGMIDHGEAVPELTRRVQSIFTDLRRSHAATIARTESSRAVHAASEMSAAESGVVAGKVWLVSSNSCDRCVEMGRKTRENPIPLGGEFDRHGSNPVYASVKMPPLHPRCRCSVTYVLLPEYQAMVDANPPAAFDPGPLGPDPGA